MKFFTKFSPAKDSGTSFEGCPSLTQTQFADQCDLKFILARLQAGDMSMLRTTGLMYADVSTLPPDLQSMLGDMINARNVWDNSPDLQKRFVTPENLIDFLSQSDNRDEAIKLGLIPSPFVEKPVKVEITNPVTPNPSPSVVAAD